MVLLVFLTFEREVDTKERPIVVSIEANSKDDIGKLCNKATKNK